MDPLKEAFLKIKEEISFLKEEISILNKKISTLEKDKNSTIPTSYILENSPNFDNSNNSTVDAIKNSSLEALKTSNIQDSIGNKGVPTDKQTNRQTDEITYFSTKIPSNDFDSSDFEKAQEILSSLDSIKKNIRKTFKRLTPQEMLVFSTLYNYEEQKYDLIDYKLLSEKLNLSESSIRDYTNRLIKKGIPIIKKRINNKKIQLNISPNLKEITNLKTINKLRNI